MELLLRHVEKSPLVLAAITAAVHQFYYDRVLSKNNTDKQELADSCAADILSNLWNLNPNWRYIILQASQKYNCENVTSVSVFGKPTNLIDIDIKIDFN